jgi:malto-oligosyltrehalose trehalohydrolase
MTTANPHGASVAPDGMVTFRLWAPASDRVALELSSTSEVLPMEARGEGWHELTTDQAAPGSRYRFVLANGMRVPDPASRYQPEDVHGPSELIDPSQWHWGQQWEGRPWEEAVIYELHIGTFTEEGTFRGAIGKLDHLMELGITAIEIMPVGAFAGRRNWGYDGVLPYAPDSSYGRPEELKELVEAAHARGLMVLLDVVYNHFGPEGNYIPVYAPQFFTNDHITGWGAGINFDGPGSRAVRDFVIHNALYWVEQLRVDGLRLDAVHAIFDNSGKHILHEIAERVHTAAGTRHVHLVLENERNEARWLERDFMAQWNDDAHHALHTRLTGEATGYYAEYFGDTGKLGRALAEGFAFQGEVMTYQGHARGEQCAHLPPNRFIAFLQNHDQIGNRALGDRISRSAPAEAVRAAAAVYLLLPQIPMLFMGEEWNAKQPFPFFCDFGPELGEAVRSGRQREFSKFPAFQNPEQRAQIPDPQAEETFAAGKLCWEDCERGGQREWLEGYRRILAARRKSIVPLLGGIARAGRFEAIGDGAILVRWETAKGHELVLAANLSGDPVSGFPPAAGSLIWQEGGSMDGEGTLAPWSVRWSLERLPGVTQ